MKLLGVMVTMALAGCTAPPAPPVPVPSAVAPSAVGPARVTPTAPSGRVIDVPCSHAIANRPTPDTPAPVLDVVDLAVGTTLSVTHEPRSGWLGTKRPLGIRADAAVELLVAPAAVDRARIGWGNSGAMGTHLRTAPCAHTTGWLWYPGGYEVTAPMCVPLIIRSAGREARVGIGIGADCA